MTTVIKDELVAAIAYTIYVDNEKVETIEKNDAIEYLHGFGNIVEGLEEALAGKAAGDAFDVTVPPEKAYGDYIEDDVIEVELDDFDEEGEMPEIGMEVELLDEDGDIIEGVIVELQDGVAIVDLNPPLAGKTIRYAGEVVSVRPATEEELEWGFPESLLDEMFGEEYDDDHDH